MSECAKCGVSVSVLGGMEFDDTDLCSSCLYSRVLELEQALREKDIHLAGIMGGLAMIEAALDEGNIYPARTVIKAILAREEKEESHEET